MCSWGWHFYVGKQNLHDIGPLIGHTAYSLCVDKVSSLRLKRLSRRYNKVGARTQFNTARLRQCKSRDDCDQ